MVTRVIDPSHLAHQHAISVGNLDVNFDNYGVSIDGDFVELSLQEFETLRLMIDNLNYVLPYSTLAQVLWRKASKRQIRNLNVLVHRLRQKLAKSSPFTIKMVRGRGYGLVQTQISPERRDRLVGAEPMVT